MTIDKKSIISFLLGAVITVLITVPITTVVIAEQSGDTPESGVTSRIKQLYDSLVTDNKGSESAGSWGDWGAMWNRIYSATEYEIINYSLQQFDEYDDYEGPGGNGEAEDDYTGEESEWTNTAPNVWKDERTGLYWSNDLGNYTNVFPNQDHSSCPFFSSDPRGGYDGLDADCGNAINACGILELDRDSLEAGGDAGVEVDWYLPTEKELLQAYIDGIFNQTTPAFTTLNFFWSSTEVANISADAWGVTLVDGYVNVSLKTNSTGVRCVSRNL